MDQSRRDFLGFAMFAGIQVSPLGWMGNRKGARNSNPYLHSAYAPIEEERVVADLHIEGKLPQELQGTYFRNGPNPVYQTDPHHWFDGDGMIHRIGIENGRASYRNKFVQTWGYRRERVWGGKIFPGLNEVSLSSVGIMALNQIFDSTPFKDTSNTDLIYFNKNIISLWWLSGVPYALDPETLESRGVAQFENYSGHMAAHARVDPNTGELFFLNFSQISPWVKVGSVTKTGELKWIRKYSLTYPKIFHDVLLTKNYVVLMDYPVGYHTGDQAGIRLGENESSRIVLIPRNDPTASEIVVEFDPCYVLHGLNAYEVGSDVILTVNKFLSPFTTRQFNEQDIPYVGALRVQTIPCRWIVNTKTRKLKEEVIFEENTEFPRINDDYLGSESRFSYHPVLLPKPEVEFGKVVKYDWKSGAKAFLELDASKLCEEFVFIPKEGSQGEDEGWIASLIHDTRNGTQSFDIFDAKTMDPKPVARILFPENVRIPMGFHSKWVSRVELTADSST